ncbi:MAG TPA: RCC1 repeat- and reductase domain-containing protein, partial [Actinomycetota bacterium]|nr:RCC1 repeat- and reductase domain-containing protein [Actinomycetota bacterium]
MIFSVVALVGSILNSSAQSAVAATDRQVKAWGDNSNGQLGDDRTDESHVPITVHNLSNVKRISAGCDYALALKMNGTVRAWGSNGDGQLGNGDAPNDSDVPVTVTGLDHVKAISAGAEHALALKENGTVRAWGSNFNGELGDDSTDPSDVPIRVPGLDHVKAIAAGQNTSFALKENGTVMAWGKNGDGQLGNGDNPNDSHVPIKIGGLDNVTAIATHCEGYTVMALKQNGTVRAWGYNTSG